jgi:2'-5' RNA ligase
VSTARLFAAVDLPAPVRDAVAAWGREGTAGDASLRAVPAANLHLTLVFLGSREEAESARIGALVTAAAAGPVALALGAALWLAPRRPHVLTLAVADPEGSLGRLQAAVAATLRDGAGHEDEGRAFRPHVTVARVRRGARVDPARHPLPPAPRAAFLAESLTLYRSRPGPGGSRYEAVARAALA